MKIIATVDKNWAIEYNNGTPVTRVPEDIKKFKHHTIGDRKNIIVMDNNIFNRIGKLLPLRTNLIISKDGISYKRTEKELADDTQYLCLPSVGNALDNIINWGLFDKTFVIGGEELFHRFIPYCDGIYITKLDYEFENPSSYFPTNMDENPIFTLVNQSLTYDHNGLKYSFCDYINTDCVRI